MLAVSIKLATQTNSEFSIGQGNVFWSSCFKWILNRTKAYQQLLLQQSGQPWWGTQNVNSFVVSRQKTCFPLLIFLGKLPCTKKIILFCYYYLPKNLFWTSCWSYKLTTVMKKLAVEAFTSSQCTREAFLSPAAYLMLERPQRAQAYYKKWKKKKKN